MKKLLLLLFPLLLLIFFLFPNMAAGQNTEKQRRIEETKRKALEETELKILKGEDRFVIDYGTWFNYRLDDYHNDDNSSSTPDTLDYTYSFDVRFWIKATLKPPVDSPHQNTHSLYFRWKDIRTERRPANINRGHDHDGPDLDYGYLVLDFNPCWLEVGRRYFSVGQGIAYSNVNDGAEFYASLTDWNVKAFASHTLPKEENIDTSVPGWDKNSRRLFYGVEGTYLGIPDHGIYCYLLVQRDYSGEDPDDPFHAFTYNSEYIGLGSQGKIMPGMHYWVETIKEMGSSTVYTGSEKRDVDAWAGDFGITYDWDVYSHPNISIEYAFGTGDPDRSSVTDTQGGNFNGDDKNFLYFGYLPAGYALSPRLSNLHFYKAAALLKPLENWRIFRNLSIGADYYQYFKDRRTGGIYDTDATVDNTDIGREIDLTLSWQILSDLSCRLEYGHFEPGDAYPDSADESETYFSSSVTVMF